ncbi:hypothetical protein CEXT_110431 [Caerostris extrusa]|uniref:Uncharacterized protein n=1 Tax=Caerostris extrusa TaxID=172846 RepID=A0AAV4SQ58_CAEEX|nr:hypothetical protein CEXT_110431 [Caerostris extrusa]
MDDTGVQKCTIYSEYEASIGKKRAGQVRNAKNKNELLLVCVHVSYPGLILSVYNVAELAKIAFEGEATIENDAVEGFQVTVIYPFDCNKFTEAYFAPFEVID